MELENTYSRKCSICGKIVTHPNEKARDIAIFYNRKCRSCSQFGHKVSEESKKKMSLLKVGKPTWSSLHKEEFGKRYSGKNHPFYGKHHSEEMKRKQSERYRGAKLSDETKKKVSDSNKKAWNNPVIKKKYYDALSKTKWLKVRPDLGQLELLEKWNKLGFNFQPNYQIHTDDFLCYVDGYDKEKSVVLEYDSKYHNGFFQKEKDLIRQQKIIDILKPKKFWRYNKISKTFIDCLSIYKEKHETNI